MLCPGSPWRPERPRSCAADAPRLVPLGADDHQPAGRVVVAVELLDFFRRQIGRLVGLAERRLAARADAAHLTLFDAGPEFDVGAAAGHVGGDRDRAGLARARHDFRLALVILGVQHLVLQAAPLQHARQRLRHVHAHRAHQHRQAALVHPLDFVHDGVVLLAPRLVDEVVLVDAPHRAVGGDHHHVELVDLEELGLFGLRRARHPRELLVHAEIVLDRDGRERLRLFAYRHAFLRFHGLMQAVGPAPARHQPPGELVDDEDLAVLHDVLHVLLVQGVGLQQLVDDVQDFALLRILGLDQAAALEFLRGAQLVVALDGVDRFGDVGDHEKHRILRRHRLHPLVGEVDGMAALVQHEVQVVFDVAHLLVARRLLAVRQAVQLDALHQGLDPRLLQQLHETLVLRHGELRLIQLDAAVVLGGVVLEQRLGLADQVVSDGGLLAHQLHDLRVVERVLLVRLGADLARNDQRRARLVDEDRVDLVDDGVVVAALHPLLQPHDHVVAQVVEAELVVGAVRDVAEVGGLALGRGGLRVVDAADGEAEPREQVAHPLGVAPREVVVDGDEVRAMAGERVQVQRQRRDERLAFARRHFGDFALVQHDAADQLHVVGHHVPRLLVARHHDLRSDEPAAGFAHRGERLRQQLVERGLQRGAIRLLRPRELLAQRGPLGRVGAVVLFLFEPLDVGREVPDALGEPAPELLGLGLEHVVARRLELLLVAVDRVHERADALQLPREARARDFRDQRLQHRSPISDTARPPRCTPARRRARDSVASRPRAPARGCRWPTGRSPGLPRPV